MKYNKVGSMRKFDTKNCNEMDVNRIELDNAATE